jgi:hypothetical protein
LGHYALNYDRGRGYVIDKIYNLASVHHGYIEDLTPKRLLANESGAQSGVLLAPLNELASNDRIAA